jgi:hypothetical protein
VTWHEKSRRDKTPLRCFIASAYLLTSPSALTELLSIQFSDAVVRRVFVRVFPASAILRYSNAIAMTTSNFITE